MTLTLSTRSGASIVPILGKTVYLAWQRAESVGQIVSGGACDFSPEGATVRARAELIERVALVDAAVSLPIHKPLSVTQSARSVGLDLLLRDARAVGQHHWIEGKAARSGESVAIPAQAVLLGWDPPQPEIRLCSQTTIGTAAGIERASASAAALAEVLERDLLQRLWDTESVCLVRGRHLLPLSAPGAVLQALDAQGIEVEVFVADQLPFELALVALHRGGGAAITFGAAARERTEVAIRHALLEAIAVRAALASTHTPSALERLPWDDARRAARLGSEHLARLDRLCKGEAQISRRHLSVECWVRIAEDTFAHEPILIELPSSSSLVVIKAICPGASVLRCRDTRLAPLPCPVA